MQFFREKPLCLCIFVMLCGFSLFSFSNTLLSIVIGALFLAALLAFVVYQIIKQKPTFSIVLTLLFIALALLSFLYFRIYRNVPRQIDAPVRGEILEVYDGEFGRRLDIRCESIGEEDVSSIKISVYTSDKDTVLARGDVISANMDLYPLYGDDSDNSAYSFSKGFCAGGDITGEINVLTHNPRPIDDFLDSVRHTFHNYIINAFGENGGGLFLALIIGDKSTLNSECSLDFSRIGISHMLALSGQHLAILSLLIHILLSLIGLNKKWRMGILSVFTVCYMILTGFTPSVVRAGIMLILSCLFFLLGKPHDISTVLFISVFLFILAAPYAITDTSLLLSALATFGVTQAIHFAPNVKSKALRIFSPLILSVITSLFAMLYTCIVTVTRFSFVSVLSPVSTLIFTLLIQIYIYAGLLLSLLGLFLNVTPISAFLYEVIHTPAHFISSFRFGYYSTGFAITQVFSILLLVLLLAFLIFKTKHRKIAICLIGCVFAGVYLSAMIGTGIQTSKNDILYMSEKNHEQIFVTDSGEITLIDILPKNSSSARETTEHLAENHYPHIDNYVLVGYSSATVRTIESLLRSVKIKSIFIPKPTNNEEEKIVEQIITRINDASAKYYLYDEENNIALNALNIYTVQLRASSGFAPLLSLSYFNNKYTYFGKGAMHAGSISLSNALLKNSRCVIFGNTGYSSESDITEIDNLPLTLHTVINASSNITFALDVIDQIDAAGNFVVNPNKISILE